VRPNAPDYTPGVYNVVRNTHFCGRLEHRFAGNAVRLAAEELGIGGSQNWSRFMLHHEDRANRIHIISMDQVLLQDIHERLREYPGAESIELVKPDSHGSVIRPEDIRKLARDTTTSRVIIIDVRTNTRARLQPAHSEIVRFNRPDFDRYCYCVLVGDGPMNYFHSDKGMNAFPSYLAELRIDFSAAAFFGDPFLYYSMKEMQEMAMHEHDSLPERISRHFEKYFHGGAPAVSQVRTFFRAADELEEKKAARRKERAIVLAKLCVRMITDVFPDQKEQVLQALSRQGLDVPGQTLRCNIYPFFFEECVLELFKKAQAAR
jgi:hypothetical protein